MTRKHFIAFAKALKESKTGTLSPQDVARVCATFNPDFNARWFLDAAQ